MSMSRLSALLLGGVIAGCLIMGSVYAADTRDQSVSEKKDKASCCLASDPCRWIVVTVSNNADVWWGNRGRAIGPYLKFAKADLSAVKADDGGFKNFGPVYFDLDKSDLKPEALAVLDQAAAHLKAYPNAVVRVEGNCCDLASNEYNIKLGMRRADSVKNRLVELGIDTNRIATISLGEEQRVTTNPKERPLNRRADIKAQPKR